MSHPLSLNATFDRMDAMAREATFLLQQGVTMFHNRDGLFFERLQNGGIRIIKTYDRRDPRPDNVVLDHTITQSEFASIVAFATPFGETSETYATALGFLQAGQ